MNKKYWREDKMSENNNYDSQTEEIMLEDEKKEPQLSFFQRIINVFINPVKVMEDISIKPTILVPILLAFVIFTLLNVARFGLLKELTFEQIELQMAQNPNATEIPEAMKMTSVYFALVTACLVPLFVIFIKGLFSHGMTQLFDGKGKLKQSISVVAFSYLVVMFGEIIRAIIGLLTGNYIVSTGLDSLVPNLETTTPLYSFLASLDIFAIWYLILSIIGISIVHKISKGKAAVVVLTPWIILVGFNVVMVVIRG